MSAPLLPLDPDELLSTTRAVRKRLDLERPVDPSLIRECIEMAAQAPTGGNGQGWHIGEVPVHVIPVIEGRFESGPVALHAGIWGSLMPAAWSFCLAARARGLGTCWTSLHLIQEKEAAELLGLPDNVMQGALIPVAHTKGTEFQPGPRRDLTRVIHRDSW